MPCGRNFAMVGGVGLAFFSYSVTLFRKVDRGDENSHGPYQSRNRSVRLESLTVPGTKYCKEISMATKEKQTGIQNPKLKAKEYEKELKLLQAKLCQLQEWVKTHWPAHHHRL